MRLLNFAENPSRDEDSFRLDVNFSYVIIAITILDETQVRRTTGMGAGACPESSELH